ncbi:recombinase family protein [Deinococcus deserti]|uniref:Putative resolvase, N terminal domain (Putative serine recombinase family, catalytic domain) n=1 Tax=Deinococcus deserti (strain DSM 17065 / CIP 109153 / LMG 22923 / VCD115) TaxID=546414 RepID=C1CX48_DEIDV|nr:recombinase family protein [Deinococcus deserti]ACO46765.1 putative resolvase, N terminal domain (putative serine recombinase family, catalytic domain) [Deinococcus deserti VCD115]
MTVHRPQEQKTIAYYRVSTQKQGQSGLGLEAQQACIERHVQSHDLTLIATYTEVETGTSKRQRTEISRAIAHAKAENAVLLIAKLDRLSRNLHFVTGLLESGVQFVACDMPHANTLTIQLLAVMAEHEAKATSQRTKEALAAAKSRGTKLGSPRPMTEETRALGRAILRQEAREGYANVRGYIETLRENGMALRAIADRLNGEGFRTRQGKDWTAVQVTRVLQRYSE